jgi:hypothetical protein
VLHAVPAALQPNARQSVFVVVQLPTPLHVCALAMPPLHVEPPGQSFRGSRSSFTFAHVPSFDPVALFTHAVQVEVHAALQQTPSAQKPEVH